MKNYRIYYFIAVLFIFGGICLFAYEDPCKYKRKYVTGTVYSGVVSAKYRDPESRYALTIVINSVKYSVYNLSFYDSISIGDTVVKDLGTVKYLLLKNSDTLVFYPQCGSGYLFDKVD